MDPEEAHDWVMKRLPAASGPMSPFLTVNDSRLTVKIGDLIFPNPVGLAAGLDKKAELINVLHRFGFGFAEIGTFTLEPQYGQDKPRLFRYPHQQALINRMGFNNPGAEAAIARLERRQSKKIPIGVNLGKLKTTPPDKAPDEYAAIYKKLAPVADYATLNVSSPNTPGLRDLQSVDLLKEILMKILETKMESRPPLFVKIAPDLADEDVSDIARLALFHKAGLIATNTTLDHTAIQTGPDQRGGLSGQPLRARSDEVLTFLRKETKGEIPLIGVGGIFSAEDAYRKIRLGASLVQVYTGWIYNGPGLIPAINKGLLRLLKRDGFESIMDAVGVDV